MTDNNTSTLSLSFVAGWMLFPMPNQQCQSTEGSSSPKDRLQSHQVHLTMSQSYTCMQYSQNTKMNLSTVKWAQWDKTQSRELLGLFICVCIALRTIVAHNIAQNRPDNFPSYPPDNHNCFDDVYLREGWETEGRKSYSKNTCAKILKVHLWKTWPTVE